MFIRKKKNKSGSVSIQILLKEGEKNKLIKSIGSAIEESDIAVLVAKAQQEIQLLSRQRSLFVHAKDAAIESFITELSNGQIRIIGPELVFGRLYDYIGYSAIDKDLFRHLVIARLAFPLSKLKTIEYLYRFQGVTLDLDSVYRFLDKLNNELKEQVEQISFNHTKRILKDDLRIVFYDMTTPEAPNIAPSPAHICLSFVAYSIYKELERVLKIEHYPLSVEKAAEITHNMYQIEIMLPESKQTKNILLKMDSLQAQLIQIINKNYLG